MQCHLSLPATCMSRRMFQRTAGPALEDVAPRANLARSPRPPTLSSPISTALAGPASSKRLIAPSIARSFATRRSPPERRQRGARAMRARIACRAAASDAPGAHLLKVQGDAVAELLERELAFRVWDEVALQELFIEPRFQAPHIGVLLGAAARSLHIGSSRVRFVRWRRRSPSFGYGHSHPPCRGQRRWRAPWSPTGVRASSAWCPPPTSSPRCPRAS